MPDKASFLITPTKLPSLFMLLKRLFNRKVSGEKASRVQCLPNHSFADRNLITDTCRIDRLVSLPLDEMLLRRYLEGCQNCLATDTISETTEPNIALAAQPAHNHFKNNAIVILCIGTDRLIGDSLGPLTGSLLSRRLESSVGESLLVYGTLENTIHACNLSQALIKIKKKHPSSVIIAVDASLSHEYPTGTVLIRLGSLKPGMGVQKDLPAVGDISITGITGAQSNEPYLTLQTTRLSLIMAMAEQICACITSVCC